ncbi:MAG TPA: MFS transporter, partial [Gemmatimonadales bacterium]
QVVGFRIIDRLGKGLRTPPRDALIAEVARNEVRGRAFGFHRAADHFGAVIGSLAAWWLLEHGASVPKVIGWSALPGVVAVVVLAVVLKRRDQGPGTGDRGQGGVEHEDVGLPGGSGPMSRVPGPSFFPPIFALTALTFFRLPEALLILRIQDRGVSVTAVPLIWAGLHVVRSASSFPGGGLVDRHGARRVVAGGGVLFAAVALALGLPVSPLAAVALFLALGLVAGLTESGERTMVARLAPRNTGRGFGAYHALTGLAALPAGIAFGALYQGGGGAVALWASAIGMLIAVGWWLMVSPEERVRRS